MAAPFAASYTRLMGDKSKVIARHREMARQMAEPRSAEPDGVRCSVPLLAVSPLRR
jgi:hypothetical protein